MGCVETKEPVRNIHEDDSDPAVLVGPIIGMVTESTARILFEFDFNGKVTVNLSFSKNGVKKVLACSELVRKEKPRIFEFRYLDDDIEYKVTVSNMRTIEPSFKILNRNRSNFKFVVLSCNDRSIYQAFDAPKILFADLLKRIRSEGINYLFQTGDQVYMDDPKGKKKSGKPYYTVLKELGDKPEEYIRENYAALREGILRLLRKECRQSFNQIGMKRVFANIPQLCIFDDHQLRDDWGYDRSSRAYGKYTLDGIYGSCARQVIYEYERQLREDVDFDKIDEIKEDHYLVTFGDTAFFFMDVRGARTWHNLHFGENHERKKQLGDLQLNQFLNLLLEEEDKRLENVKNLFIVSTLAFVFLSRTLMKLAVPFNNDAQESWILHEEEQTVILESLLDWQNKKDERRVMILDGDCHLAGFTNIFYRGRFAFPQFTTSSIASTSPSWFEYTVLEALKKLRSLRAPWAAKHFDWTNDYNYGIVEVKNNANQTVRSRIDCTLISCNNDDKKIREKAYYYE